MVFEQTTCQLQIITEVRLPFVTLGNAYTTVVDKTD